MPGDTKPTIPKRLRKAGRALFRAISQDYLLEPHHRTTLQGAAENLDRYNAAREVLDKEGLVYEHKGKYLARPEELRRGWREQVEGLGLEADVLRVLTRAQDGGVPLTVLLDDDDLLRRLRERNLLACFRVVT